MLDSRTPQSCTPQPRTPQPRTPQSWVFGANDPALGLGLNHLPYTAFVEEATGRRHLGVAIGACVLDLHAAAELLPKQLESALREPYLNTLMALSPQAVEDLRQALQFLLSLENRDRTRLEAALLPTRTLRLELPVSVGNYTDFYASRHHAQRVGELFRPEKPLLENYDWLPIGYHGRASSLVASGTPVRRPRGQIRGEAKPSFEPTRKLDYELELAMFIGAGNALGEPIAIAEAGNHLFGVSLLNDWSARDIQAWEYQPLGPFLGKNFATSVSPLLTPIAALEQFRVPATPHVGGTLDYLLHETDQDTGAFSLHLQVELSTNRSRQEGRPAFPISEVDARTLYWTPAQMIAHHTASGCNLLPGDLLATGTISGVERESAGCLLERTGNGTTPLCLPNGETRCFLEDGDEITLTGVGEGKGELPIRLGACRARVLA